MAHGPELPRWQGELVDACKEGDEERARGLVSRSGMQPRKLRSLLEAMLEDEDALVRQAGAFGLGELGGASSARRLEQRLAEEEARGDYDGDSVVEAITLALGRIKGASARATLARRLERLASAARPASSDVYDVAGALWRQRAPELVAVVRRSLEELTPPLTPPLQGLLALLEKPPEELSAWAREPSVPLEYKAGALTVLREEIPDAWIATLPAFISTAQSVLDMAVRQRGSASSYCEYLLSLLLGERERFLPRLSEATRSELRTLSRQLLAASSRKCSLDAAILLQYVGRPEDAPLIEAHRPAEPVLAKVFDTAAQALRDLPAEGVKGFPGRS